MLVVEEVENIAQHAVNGETVLRHKPVDIPIARPRVSQPIQKRNCERIEYS